MLNEIDWISYNSSYSRAYRHFARKCFGEQAYQSNKNYIAWLYQENLLSRQEDDFLIGVLEDGRVIGCLHKMRLNWNYRGNIVEVPAFHNYMVDPDFRHAAGFFLLMKALSNEQHALMPGTGRVTSEIYEKLGFQEAKTSWYLKILRPIHGAFIMSARKFLSRPFRARYFDSPRLEETSSSGFSVTLSPTDDLLEPLVGAMNSHEPEVAAPLWTVEQLKWRFFHSLGPRHLLIYEDSPRTIRSFAILSLGPRRGLNLGRIVELNAASVDSLRQLLHQVVAVTRESQGHVLQFLSADQKTNDWLALIGWKSRRSHAKSYFYHKIKNQRFEHYSFNSNAGDFGFEAIR